MCQLSTLLRLFSSEIGLFVLIMWTDTATVTKILPYQALCGSVVFVKLPCTSCCNMKELYWNYQMVPVHFNYFPHFTSSHLIMLNFYSLFYLTYFIPPCRAETCPTYSASLYDNLHVKNSLAGARYLNYCWPCQKLKVTFWHRFSQWNSSNYYKLKFDNVSLCKKHPHISIIVLITQYLHT